MQPWPIAWSEALYGSTGFYRRPEGPAGHFRTASHAAPDELAGAVSRLAFSLGASGIVDVGAGRGELLTSAVGRGQELWGVDVVPRPPALPPVVNWAQGLGTLPDSAFDGALVVAWELLDVVPVTVLEIDEKNRPRVVLVDPVTGREQLGETVDDAGLTWVERWWPTGDLEEGDRIEDGRARDAFWEHLTRRAFGNGAVAALCVDYAHTRRTRPPSGSLTGFRAGHAVPPRPDGTMDITAHVAIDAIAAGGPTVELTTQAQALRALGVTSPELLDEGGLGGFAWLLQVP